MTIRTRLALWYAVIFSASLLAIGLVVYSDLVVEQRHKVAKHHGNFVDEDAGTDLTQIILLYGGSAIVIGLLGGWWLTRARSRRSQNWRAPLKSPRKQSWRKNPAHRQWR